jgi:hypothetical protein
MLERAEIMPGPFQSTPSGSNFWLNKNLCIETPLAVQTGESLALAATSLIDNQVRSRCVDACLSISSAELVDVPSELATEAPVCTHIRNQIASELATKPAAARLRTGESWRHIHLSLAVPWWQWA